MPLESAGRPTRMRAYRSLEGGACRRRGRRGGGADRCCYFGVAGLAAGLCYRDGRERGSPFRRLPLSLRSPQPRSLRPAFAPTTWRASRAVNSSWGATTKTPNPDERPAHQVTLSPYCIDLHEVTAAQYKACSDIGECKRAPFEVDWKDVTATEKKVFSAVCNANQPDRGDHPSNCVDWDMAATYCAHAKKRLPTEAEWEFAARGPDGADIHGATSSRQNPDERVRQRVSRVGGQEGVEMGFHGKAMYPDDDGVPTTAPVGSFPEGRSRYGLFDVVGNVWEWTSDWEGKYGADPVVDPTGANRGTARRSRGRVQRSDAFMGETQPALQRSSKHP